MANSEGSDKRPKSPSSQQAAKPGWFPLGYKEGFSQWWAGLTPAYTEHKVLSFIPEIQKSDLVEETNKCGSKSSTSVNSAESQTQETDDPYGPRKWFTQMVKLSGKDRAIHEFSVERIGEKVENDMVMLHGYGAGLGFFFQNFEPMSRLPGWKLYALDLLGMGLSSRPPFRIHSKDKVGKITEAENFFIDALEEWRIQKKIEKFTLFGHSMGGYMATCYALKYPGRVKKLILVSPVGIPEDPDAVNEDMPEPSISTIQNEFTQNQEELVAAKDDEAKVPRRQIPGYVKVLWDANISPFSLVRWAGPLGPRLASGWTSRRFSHLPADQAQALHDYSYSIFRQAGSGEYALAYILAPGAFARSPLIRRIQGVGRQLLKDHDGPTVDDSESAIREGGVRRENGVPIVFMYGSHDWMDQKGGVDAAKKVLQATEKALEGKSKDEKNKDQGSAKVIEVSKAGHHLYLDNPTEFNERLLEEMQDVMDRDARTK